MTKISFKQRLLNLQANVEAALGIKPQEKPATTPVPEANANSTQDNPPNTENANDTRVSALEAGYKAQNEMFADFIKAMAEREDENESLQTQLATALTKIKELEKGPGATPTVATDANGTVVNNNQPKVEIDPEVEERVALLKYVQEAKSRQSLIQ